MGLFRLGCERWAMRWATWLFAGASLFAVGAHGEVAAAAPAAADDEAPAPVELPAVAITARRWPGDDASALPTRLAVIDPTALAAVGARALPELLAGVPGLFVRQTSGQPGEGELSLRGGGEGSGLRTLVLIDGHRLNPPDLSGLDWSLAPLDDLARVEVLRGPQSVLYGNRAVGGVVLVQTRPPGGRARLAARLTLENDNGGQAALAAEVPLPDGGLRVTLTADDRPGWREQSAARGQSLTLRWATRPPVLGGALDTALGWATTTRELPGPLPLADALARPKRSFAVGDTTATSSHRAHLLWEPPQPGGFAPRVALAYTSRNLDWQQAGAPHLSTFLHTGTASALWQPTALGARWSLGLDAAGDVLQAMRGGPVPRGEANLTLASAAAFALGQWALTPALDLTAGTRLDHATLRLRQWSAADPFFPNPNDPANPCSRARARFTEPAGTFGLVLRPTPGWSAFARLDRLFRTPATDEIGSYQGFPLAVPFNADLAPERGWHAEAGATWQQGPWSASGAIFGQHLWGEIAFDPVANLNLNLPSTRRYGAEVELAWARGPWRLEAQAAITVAELRRNGGPGRAGDAIPLVPHWLGGLAAEWQALPALRWRATVDYTGGQSQGGDYAGQRPRLPAFASVGLAARWQLDRRWTITATGRNLLDRRGVSAAYSGGYYPTAGRQWSVGFSCSF